MQFLQSTGDHLHLSFWERKASYIYWSLHLGSCSAEFRGTWALHVCSIVMADASCQMKSVEVTITHFSLLALLSSFLQPCSYSWRSKCLGSIIWQADVYASRPKCFPWISTNRIQWRKHAFLDGLWGTETGVQQKCHWRKSKANLWRLHFYPFSKRGILLSLIHPLMPFCTVNSNVFKATKIPRDNSSFPVLPHFTANKERSSAKRQTLRWESVLLSVLLSFWLEENTSYATLTCWCEEFSLRHN